MRPDLGRAPWYAYPAGRTRLVGQRLTATGMWLKQPRNRNFAPEDDEEGGEAEEEAEDEEDESDDGDGGEGEGEGEGEGDDDDEDDEDNGSKLRRAEFTLLGLDD